MRKLRPLLAGTVTIALLGGLGGVGIAQSDDEAGPVTHFTGMRLSVMPDTTDEEWWEEDGLGHARGFRLTEAVEWSDPRLPSEKQTVMNMDMYDIGEFRELPIVGTTLLEGPDGYWTGEFTTFCDSDGDCHGMNTITGHGAYDGLFAVFRSGSPEDPDSKGDVLFEGLIFEGEMPPMPDPVEPSVQ